MIDFANPVSPDEWDSITLANLRCAAHIGCKAKERQLLQVMFLSITIYLDTRPAAANDDLALTVNYSHLSKEIISLVSNSQCQLIETLADQVAQKCLADYPPSKAVRVQINKPAGLPNADGAVLSIYRQR